MFVIVFEILTLFGMCITSVKVLEVFRNDLGI